MKKLNVNAAFGAFGGTLLFLVLIILFLLSATSCTSKSGQRLKRVDPTFWIMDINGDDSYPEITYGQVQDYLSLGFYVYCESGETSISSTDGRYAIVDIESDHVGIIGFDNAFKMFYEFYCPEYTMDYLTMKTRSVYRENPPILLPVD